MTTKRSIFNAFLTVAAISVLAVGGFAQGKHGGKKGGGHGDRGKPNKQWNGDRGGKQQKHWNGSNRGGNDDRGKGNGWGRQPRSFDGSREFQQQIRKQQRQQNDWAKAQQKVYREQVKQQRDHQREQQKQYQRTERDQRRYQQQQYRTVIRQFGFDDRRLKRDNGRHNGWVNGQPRGNHYGWYSPDEKRFRKEMKKAQREANKYRYHDPLVTYVPIYRGVEYYQYQPQREYVVRSLISTFFTQGPSYYDYYPAPQTYTVYQPYQPRYYETVSYAPTYDYYDPGYGYDDPYYGSQMFGDGDLKSSLLNIGFGLLQGFLGQGYLDGLNQGLYAREVYGPQYTAYHNPYEAPAEYYSPYVSSFADERQIFEEGYRLGYEDGLRDRDPYAAYDGGIDNVDLISAFLTNTLLANV